MWFKVDDKLHDHGKAHAAGTRAMGLWVMAGSWCADNLTDGFVPRRVMTRWGTPKDAAALVTAGLWSPDTDTRGEPGWRFHDWSRFQPTRAEKLAEREARAKAGRAGGKASGRSRREANHEANTKQSASCWVEPPSRPVRSVVKSSSHLSSVPRPNELDDDAITKIMTITGGDHAHAEATARTILDSLTTPPRSPTAYVLRCIRNEPDRYRWTRPRPRKGDPGECPTHIGQWADSCSGCVADKIAGDR